MNKETVNQVLDALAARLAVPVSHLWAVLVRQAYVEFATMTVGMLVGWAVFGALFRWFLKEHAKDTNGWADDMEFGLGIASTLAGLLALGLTFSWIAQLGYVANPEYFALTKVLGAFK